MSKLLSLALASLAWTIANAAEGDFSADDAAKATPAPATAPAAKAPATPPATSSPAVAASPATSDPAATATEPAPPAATAEKAAATPAPKVKGKYEGMYTFDWKKLTKCQFVGPVTNAMLEDPKNICKKAERSTGSPASCKVSEASEYLIFKTKEDCRVEYEEQVKESP